LEPQCEDKEEKCVIEAERCEIKEEKNESEGRCKDDNIEFAGVC